MFWMFVLIALAGRSDREAAVVEERLGISIFNLRENMLWIYPDLKLLVHIENNRKKFLNQHHCSTKNSIGLVPLFSKPTRPKDQWKRSIQQRWFFNFDSFKKRLLLFNIRDRKMPLEMNCSTSWLRDQQSNC